MVSPANADCNETIWLVISIVFMALLAASLFVNIFLWIVRRNNLKQLQEELKKQLEQNQGTAYGGAIKSTYI